MTKSKTRQRGGKSKLPPRVPSLRRLQRLSKIDFATPGIVRMLGMSTSGDRGVFVELDLHNEIRAIVADYIADRLSQVPPKEFRKRIRAFRSVVETFLRKFPTTQDEVTEAINRELDQIESDWAPSLSHIGNGLDVVLDVVKSLETVEGGAGTDANRAAHLLLAGLASVYRKRTGKRPSKKIDGKFAKFVQAVNAQIPARFKLNGLAHLIRSVDIGWVNSSLFTPQLPP